jgi:starch synthase
LVSAGWFPSGGTEEAYRNGAAALCRSFQWTFLDGREPGVRRTLWAAADIFVSLVDNIQESFGLVPLEAMSNGLPVVVSDWDGYKDTVRDGVDGWRIRTVVPPGGSGVELAQSYVEGLVTYEDYVGNASLATCVDVEAAAGAIKRLVDDEILRARLGQAGRQRALDTYDWRHVIPQYEELWGHLAELRQSEQEIAPRPSCESGHPARPDPFALYRAFATSVLADNSILSFASADPGGDYDRVCTLTLNAYGLVVLGTEQARRGVLALLIQNLPCSVAEILALGSGSGAPQLRRILVWLAKCGVIRVAAGPGPENALEGPS